MIRFPLRQFSFDPISFQPIDEGERVARFSNPEGDELEVRCQSGRPQVPAPLNDLGALARHYRLSAEPTHGGLVELTLSSLLSIPALRTIIKYPQPTRGFTFASSLVLLFADESITFSLRCPEQSDVGAREHYVREKYDEEQDKAQGSPTSPWGADPFESSFQSPDLALRTQADDEKWDELFPYHPLTRTRLHLGHLSRSLHLSETLKNAPRFVDPSELPKDNARLPPLIFPKKYWWQFWNTSRRR